MGNQQELDWAWLAGMFNGDGCFSLTLRKRESRWKCDVSLSVTQTDPCIIERVVKILEEGLGINPHIHQYKPSGTGVNVKYNVCLNKMSQIANIGR